MTKQALRKKRRRRTAAAIEDFRANVILDAALEVIGREGLTGATMQRIADHAGIAKGTLYLHFKNRDDLVRRSVLRVREEIRKRALPWYSAQGPFEERLRGLLGIGLSILEEYRGFLRVYVQLPRVTGGQIGFACRNQEDLLAPEALRELVEFLEGAMRRGEIRRTDPERLAAFIHESMTALAIRRLSVTRPASVEADLNWIVGMLLHGMLPRRRSSS